MAVLSSDHESVTVQKGDTLSQIAIDYKRYSGNKTWEQLAALNGIPGPKYWIYVGETIKLVSSSTAGSSSTSKSSNRAVINRFGLQADKVDTRTLFATWTWSKDSTEEYKVIWYYATGEGVWFVGDDSTTKYKQSVYNAPSSATKVKFKVKPIAKKKKDEKTKKYVSRWKAEWSKEKKYNFKNTPPQTPSGLQAEIKGYKLTASLDNQSDLYADTIEFQVIKETKSGSTTKREKYKTGKSKLSRNAASFTCDVTAGPSYEVRCRSVDGEDTSDWSDYIVAGGTVAPAAVKKITKLKTVSENEVSVDWDGVPNVNESTVYEIQYTTERRWFDSSSGNVSTHTVSALDGTKRVSHADITGLQTGDEYFFRMRAKNGDAASAWTKEKSIIIGKVPEAPTTWSNTTTAVVGEDLYLYWIHNSEDGSSQTYAQLALTINGVKTTYTIKNPVQTKDSNGNALPTTKINGITHVEIATGIFVPKLSEDDKDKTTCCVLKITSLSSGAKINWKVKTAGILKDGNGDPKYGPWSASRGIKVNAPPTLSIDILKKDDSNSLVSIENGMIEQFPFYISCEAGPNPPQKPIGYHMTINSLSKYYTLDELGNEKIVNEGEEIYSGYFNTDEDLLLELTPAYIDLENNKEYRVTCVVSMSSGLTATDTYDFIVSWTDQRYSVNAEISIDPDNLTAYIRPYCENEAIVYCIANYDSSTGKYIPSQVVADVPTGMPLEGVFTTDGQQVYLGIMYDENTEEDVEVYYYEQISRTILTDAKLAVYRREFDGGFTEIASDIDAHNNSFITDPHPSLDLARYRIVSIANETGAIYYYDVPGVPVGEKSVVIQWDEQWSKFDTDDVLDTLEQPPWSGSMLKLPYNIDISDDHSNDVSLVEYIGRKHPVSYYGTQRGETATWKVDIEKDDADTLYALRRLAIWMGDVYVREPSGSGCWANISVSFSQTHKELTIPVTLKVTRVEGGV